MNKNTKNNNKTTTTKKEDQSKQPKPRKCLIPSFLFRKFFPYLLMRRDAARISYCLRSRTVARNAKCPSPRLVVPLRATYSKVMQQFYGRRTYPSPNTRIPQNWFAAKIIGTPAFWGTFVLRCMPRRSIAKTKAVVATSIVTL